MRQLLQVQVAMILGAALCLATGLVVRPILPEPIGYAPGSVLYFVGDVLFLTAPAVAWARLRTGDWSRALELAIAMLAPVVAIATVGQLLERDSLLWLVNGMYPVMSLGAVVYLLYRRGLGQPMSRGM